MPLPKPSSRDGGPRKVREGYQESAPGCSYDEDLNWLRHSPTLERDSTLVIEKMQSTFPVRQHMVRDGRTASDILEQFPFETVPGLVRVAKKLTSNSCFSLSGLRQLNHVY